MSLRSGHQLLPHPRERKLVFNSGAVFVLLVINGVEYLLLCLLAIEISPLLENSVQHCVLEESKGNGPVLKE